MSETIASFLLIGESDVGKTHYGAQILRRLNAADGLMRLVDSDNLGPYRETMDQISRGLAGRHTPRSESSMSRWTVERTTDKATFDLHWPDYGGEQVSSMINERQIPLVWRDRIMAASGWVFMLRPSRVTLPEDVLTRKVTLCASEGEPAVTLSAQSRLVEILQMLRFKAAAYAEDWCHAPPVCVLLSCYDELKTDVPPRKYCDERLPLLASYLRSNWPETGVRIFGISPLGQALSDTDPDEDFVAKGPEKMGYVIDETGNQANDLLAPVQWLLKEAMHR